MALSTTLLKENTSIENEKEIRSSYVISNGKNISRLEKLGEKITLPKNDTIIQAQQKTCYCYIVKKGRVFSCEVLRNGEERILHMYEKNTIFLETNLIFDRKTEVEYRTAIPTELIRIHRDVLRKTIKLDSSILLELYETLTLKNETTTKQMRIEKNYNAVWNMCELFLNLADNYGKPVGRYILIHEKFSQQTIADMVGINRITAVRIIKQLKNQGVLEQKNQFYMIDREGILKYQESQEMN